MNQTNLNQARQFLVKLIPQAGEILKKFFISGKFTSKSKGGVDFLTEADETVDHFLKENIQKKFPQTQILTEETAPKDYSAYQKMSNLWIIDPLDGTVNFSRGNPHFSISVGLVIQGQAQLGVVFIPMEDKLYWAQQDQSQAFVNNQPLKISATRQLKETVIACDWGWNLEKRLEVVQWLGEIVTHVRQVKSMGSAVADLANLAEGKIDVYLHSGLKPWDVAAASLFIQKAGGKITTPDNKDWNVFCPDMLATNGILHERILELIK